MDTKIQRKTETTQSQLVHTKEEKICEISKKQLENKQAFGPSIYDIINKFESCSTTVASRIHLQQQQQRVEELTKRPKGAKSKTWDET